MKKIKFNAGQVKLKSLNFPQICSERFDFNSNEDMLWLIRPETHGINPVFSSVFFM